MNEAAALVESLLDQAAREADGILAAARAKAGEILAKADREIEARAAVLEAQAENRALQEERRIATKAELEMRRELLQAKARLLDEVFAEAYRRLLALPESEWRRLMRRLILDATLSGSEELAVPAGQEERFAGLLPEINAELARRGKRGELRVAAGTPEIEGGFVLSGGDYSMDCSLRSVLAEKRAALEPGIARMLFNQGGLAGHEL